jgi:hypothetical protein
MGTMNIQTIKLEAASLRLPEGRRLAAKSNIRQIMGLEQI